MANLLPKILLQGSYFAVGLILGLPILYLLRQAAISAPWTAWPFHHLMLTLLLNSLSICLLVTCLAVTLGFALAFLVAKTNLPGKGFWQVALVLPLSIPSYIHAIAYISLLSPRGMIYEWLGWSPWNVYGADGVVLILTLSTFPYSFLICRSQLKKIPSTWDETAWDLGKTQWQSIIQVIVPMCRPALLSSTLLISLYVLADFAAVALLRHSTFTTAIFYHLDSFDRGRASLLGLVLLSIAMLMIAVRDRWLRGKDHQSIISNSDQPSLYPLSRSAQTVALGLLSLCLLLALIIPLGVLCYHLLSESIEWSRLPGLASTSLSLALVVALTTTTISALASYGLKLWRGPGVEFFQKIACSLYGVPGILVALGMLFVARTWLGSFYGTVLPLGLGLLLRFLPQALEAMAWGQKALGKNLIDTSLDLGQGHLATLRRVFFPLVKGAVGASFLLVFVGVLKDIPVQLILRPPGMETLSVGLWINIEEAFYGQASLYGLTIVAMAALATPFILKKY